MAYHVQCGVFEGPLDLLVSLASRGQIDVQQVPVRQLIEEYRTRATGSLELEEATEVLVNLAVLVDLKARSLVPKPPPAEPLPPSEEASSDLRDRLGAQLAEYLQFRDAAQALRALEEIQSRVFVRPPETAEPGEDVLLDGVTVRDLFAAFADVLRRAQEAPREIPGEQFTVGERMQAVVRALRQAGGRMAFGALFRAGASRLEIIVTFLAVLELVRQRRIRARQQQPFSEIEVMLVGESSRTPE